MLDLTPSERRGALVLFALVLLGSAWDLLHVEPVPAPPVPEPVAAGLPSAGPPLGAQAGSGVSVPPPEGALLDLNAATASQLDALPGIGPVLAARILERRGALGRFSRPEDLLSVRGIGPRLYERLRSRVTCEVAVRTSPRDSLQLAR